VRDRRTLRTAPLCGLTPTHALTILRLPSSGTPRALVWHWDGLLAGTRRGYWSLSLRGGAAGAAAAEVCPLSPDSAAPQLLALPSSAEALLLADAVGIIVSLKGVPRGNPLAFGAPPCALAHTPPYVLALPPDRKAVEVWDRASAQRVQQLPLPTPAGGASGPSSAVGSQPSCAADDGAGTASVFAVGRAVTLLLPVALEAQARELVRSRQPEGALALAAALEGATHAAGEPPPPPPQWLDTVHAEVGFLRLSQQRWEEAAAHWRLCTSFTPDQLFPLFPHLVAPDAHQPPRERYWALHAPLSDLQSLIHASAAHQQPADAAAAAAAATRALCLLLEWLWAQPGRVPEEQRAAAGTLLLALLARTGRGAAAEALAGAAGRQVHVESALRVLAECGLHLAAAALLAARGEEPQALALCRQLLAGELRESSRVEAEARAAAAEAASTLLLRTEEAPTLLAALPWLLDAAPGAAVRALTGRAAVPVDEVLGLLRRRGGEPLLLFLEHLLLHAPQPALGEALHTELGVALIQAVALSRSGAVAAAAADDDVSDEGAPPRTRLRAFLARSSRYDAAQLLARCEAVCPPQLLRERVLLLGASGAHAQALTLLVARLGDLDGAEAFAQSRPTEAERSEAHAALLRLYLGPHPGGAAPDRPALHARAARLLSLHGDALDGAVVLDALPEDASLASALQPLAGLLLCAAHTRRTAALQAGLARRRHQVAAEVLAVERQGGVVLDEAAACGACQAKLSRPGEFRPFARFPGGLLACQRCAVALTTARKAGDDGTRMAAARDGAN